MNPHNIIKIIHLSARSLVKQKMRSLLSVSGIVCGVMAVVAMISIGEGAKKEAISQIEQLGTRNIYVKAVPLTQEQVVSDRENLSRGLTIADMARIKKGRSSADKIACLREVNASVLGMAGNLSPQVVAVSENFAELHGVTLFEGRFIASQDRQRKNLVCVLGDDVAGTLGKAGITGDFIRIDNHLFKVVGVLSRTAPLTGKYANVSARNYNEMIFIPLETSETLARADTGLKAASGNILQLSDIVIQVASTEDVMDASMVVRRILEVAHNHVRDYQFLIPLELLRQTARTQRTFNMVLFAIAGISLVVGGIGIMNIMLATVSERTREIGIRRAVGASRKHIILQFLAESVLLTLAGGIIGLITGLCVVSVASRISGWPMAISFWGIILPLQMSFLVGIFFGLYPARQAARVDPIVALRT